MKLLIDKEDVYFKDLKIPEGYRLLDDWEVLKEIRTNAELENLFINSYVFCNGLWGPVAFGYINDNLRLYLIAFNNQRTSRGVFTRIIEEVE